MPIIILMPSNNPSIDALVCNRNDTLSGLASVSSGAVEEVLTYRVEVPQQGETASSVARDGGRDGVAAECRERRGN